MDWQQQLSLCFIWTGSNRFAGPSVLLCTCRNATVWLLSRGTFEAIPQLITCINHPCESQCVQPLAGHRCQVPCAASLPLGFSPSLPIPVHRSPASSCTHAQGFDKDQSTPEQPTLTFQQQPAVLHVNCAAEQALWHSIAVAVSHRENVVRLPAEAF